ncbi:hypothetical protein ACFWA5_22750 [Streptomyces mirabilis]|uniref:hypothetical protein n=1 Tax=Streptomyces mirabilis TaxID=68239 RepID=UPI0036692EAF
MVTAGGVLNVRQIMRHWSTSVVRMAGRHRAGRAGRTLDDTLVCQALDAVGLREPVNGLSHRLDTLPTRRRGVFAELLTLSQDR